MAFQVSPGVQVQEIDLTNIVPAVSTSIGGIAGAFQWGPVNEIRTVGSEKELSSLFGTPNNDTFKYFLTASSFLKYTNALKVVRVVDSTARNAVVSETGNPGTPQLIENQEDYENSTLDGVFFAKYPGENGNHVGVDICPNAAAFGIWPYAGLFDSAPGTSDYVQAVGGSDDEMHIVVYDTTGGITGTAGTVLEKFAYVSQAADARKTDGTTNYYKEVINNSSAWLWWGGHQSSLTSAGELAASTAFVSASAVIELVLGGGVDGNDPTAGDIQTGYSQFEDAETVDVNLIMDASGSSTVQGALITLAEARKDVVVFLSPPIDATVGNLNPVSAVKDWADALTSTSYAVADSTALKVYDKYNDLFRWIPGAGHVAGLCAKTDQTNDAWWSPAGYTRGQLLGVTKLAFNPKKADRDTLYKARVNPVVAFPGEGTILFGDKTLLAKPSAFDRINVRRLFIVLEKAVATAAKYQLFEFNDEFTRAMFKNMVEPFLRDVKGRRGVTDFLVVCDGTNNTGEVIDRNEFVADIYIKPARSINFISLNFIATRTGVDFAEIVGKV